MTIVALPEDHSKNPRANWAVCLEGGLLTTAYVDLPIRPGYGSTTMPDGWYDVEVAFQKHNGAQPHMRFDFGTDIGDAILFGRGTSAVGNAFFLGVKRVRVDKGLGTAIQWSASQVNGCYAPSIRFKWVKPL